MKRPFKSLARKAVNQLDAQPQVAASLDQIQTLEAEVRDLQIAVQDLQTAYTQL